MEDTLRAVLDASVLYPASLRHLLMRLALARLYQPKWSATIHEEWIRSVVRDKPHIPLTRLYGLRDAMEKRINDATVTDYENLIDTLNLPDPNDRHVLAAAIAGDARLIVTRNLRDFPAEALAPHKIRAVHPDAFIRELIGQAPAEVIAAVHDQQRSLKNPPQSLPQLLDLFGRLDLKDTADVLRVLMLNDQPERRDLLKGS